MSVMERLAKLEAGAEATNERVDDLKDRLLRIENWAIVGALSALAAVVVGLLK